MSQVSSHLEVTTLEAASLWSTYMQMSISQKMLAHFKITCENEDVQTIVNSAVTMTNEIYETVKQLLQKAQIVLPYGFTDEDVNLTAPKLFTDNYRLFYLKHMSSVGMVKFALDKATAVHLDVRQFYTTVSRKQTLYSMK